MVFNSRPDNIKTGIFLDSGDPAETRRVVEALGFLDGQTTNPSLVSKNPKVSERIKKGEKLTQEELLSEYKKIVQEIASIIPGKSVSIEVYADHETTAETMVNQAREMFSWIDTAHIKLPTTMEGLKAGKILAHEGMRLNFTLVFKQEQAAAVNAATRGLSKGNVFVSPFIGRLDDISIRGIDVISNIMRMYKDQNSHVEVLAASIRSIEHLLSILFLQTDIVTIPGKVIDKWIAMGAPLPVNSNPSINERYEMVKRAFDPELQDITFDRINIDQDIQSYNVQHSLTDAGIKRFTEDWNNLIQTE